MKHTRISLVLLLGLLLAFSLTAMAQQDDGAADDTKQNPAELFKLSDKYWRTRHITGNTAKSVHMAEKALTAGGDKFEGHWRIARGCFWMAEQSKSDKDKITHGERGWREGQKAAELKPGRVEGYYWGVVSLGQYSKGIGIAKAFFQGISGKFEGMVEKAIALDKTYGFGGPLRAAGRYWQMVPWPKKDLKRAAKQMQESIAIYPKKLRSHYYLASIYIDMEEMDKAKKELDVCLGLDPKNEEYPDGIIFKKECEKLYAEKFSGTK